MASKGKHLNTFTQEEHDELTHRKRVQMTADNDSISYEDTDFRTADSPLILDIEGDLRKPATQGYVTVDVGTLKYEGSADGINWGGQHTLHEGNTLGLNFVLRKVRLTAIGMAGFRSMFA